ncbi:hypothetical protein V3C99_015150 [Haemonchus contortus]|uniref:WD repeat-containing protein 73 n=1 Tax=Haemonchus contortus TaxID=6289 RepID=A0A7I4YWB5_HAECO
MALPLDLPVGDNELHFMETKFLPFPESKEILIIRERPSLSSECTAELSAAIHTCLINAYGRLQFIEENKVVYLPKLLSETSIKSGHSIELSCAEVSPLDSGGGSAVLATCWVELNEHFCPCRYFGAIFRISATLHIEMTSKVETSAPVAYCTLVEKVTGGAEHRYWINYESGKCVTVYELKQASDELVIMEDPSSVFPEITLDGFPGTVIRSSRISSEKLEWNAVGFDTGRVFLSVFDAETKKVKRKQIKFSGPVSVVEFVPYLAFRTPRISESEGPDPLPCYEERFLVVSSTLGPVAIWKCVYENDELSWNNEFVLSQSEQFDTITSTCIINGNIAIGTYCGKILFYSSPYDLLCHEIASMTQVHAPIVNMKVLDHKTLCVLSTAGLHTVTRSET